MIYIHDQRFVNEMQKQAFVNECELVFMRKMNELTDTIIAKPEERIITLSGPSCSGKTITSRNIARAVTRAGRKMYQISIDNFYRSREDLNAEANARGGAPDYDSIDAIDFDLLCKVVHGIYAGEVVRLPIYDFVSGTRTGYTKLNSSRYDVIMFEGIQAIYPEVTALLGEYPYISVSINVRSGLRIGDVEFTPRELRLMRRIVRDVLTRGTAPNVTFALWDTTVIPNEDRSIVPYENLAQIKIDSLMPYEANVIRDPLLAALSTVPADDPYAARAASLAQRVSKLEPIDDSYVPIESLYSEFLGRK